MQTSATTRVHRISSWRKLLFGIIESVTHCIHMRRDKWYWKYHEELTSDIEKIFVRLQWHRTHESDDIKLHIAYKSHRETHVTHTGSSHPSSKMSGSNWKWIRQKRVRSQFSDIYIYIYIYIYICESFESQYRANVNSCAYEVCIHFFLQNEANDSYIIFQRDGKTLKDIIRHFVVMTGARGYRTRR